MGEIADSYPSVASIPLLTIGLPVFNGEDFIEAALDSLLKQTFVRWVLRVSDNASSDNTVAIVRRYAALDERITLICQPSNIGAPANFQTVAADVRTSYFMWFAADDVLETFFIESCVTRLQANPKIGMAFSGLRNIDGYGREVRAYPRLSELSGTTNFLTVFRYLWSPEIMGKANLIYSIYRTHVCVTSLSRGLFRQRWGADMAFVLGAIIQGGGVHVAPDVLFNKRYVRASDRLEKVEPVVLPALISEQLCPLEFYPEYMSTILRAVEGTKFWIFAKIVLEVRHNQLKRAEAAKIKAEEKRIKLAAKVPRPRWRDGPWMARADKLLRLLKLKRAKF